MSISTVVFCDLETEGLDPTSNCILEIFATAYGIEDVPDFYRLIRYQYRPEFMVPRVHEMHLASNLLFDCDREEAVSQQQALIDLYDWLMEVRGNNNKVRLAGFSPHFDRSFLLASMPELADHIHHQVIDVSTIRHIFQLGGNPIYPTRDGAIHRAYADTQQAISMYEQSLELIENWVAPKDLKRNEKNE